MTDFTDQDLSGSSFRRVLLHHASFREVSLEDATLTDVWLDGARITGSEAHRLELYGDFEALLVNDVDVVPLVEAELDRRHPERALMRPTDADGFREAFAVLDRLWDATLA